LSYARSYKFVVGSGGFEPP